MTGTPNIVRPSTYEDALAQEAVLHSSDLPDISVPEWMVVTGQTAPPTNKYLASKIAAIKDGIESEEVRNVPGNERLVALFGLKKSLESLGVLDETQVTVD